MGTFHRGAGKFEEAEKAWKKATELEPDYFLGYAYLAGLYDEQNKLDLAYEYYSDERYGSTYCPRSRTSECETIGFFYPGAHLDNACPEGWRLPSTEEWRTFYNSAAFSSRSYDSDFYKGLYGGDGRLSNDGEAAFYWVYDTLNNEQQRDCIKISIKDGFDKDQKCDREWKISVRCVRDVDGTNEEPSSSEQNAEKKEYDCSVTDGIKVVSPADGESFRIGDSVNVVFGSDQDYGGFMIELRFNDGASRVLLLDETLEGVTDGITCNEKKILLSAEIGVEVANDAYIYIAPYAKQSKAGKSGTFNILNACQKPAYCYRTTVDSQRRCDLDKAVADTKIQQAKEVGIFKEEFEECWDL